MNWWDTLCRSAFMVVFCLLGLWVAGALKMAG